jgi:PWWP domain
MPPVFTSRFGEIVWAQGGPGYGWWPCYIYDPRMTVGGARDLARKHLGKKHLVYFFQCLEAPFAALPDSKLTEWYAGLTENYHLGKSAKHTSKNRAVQFAEALKIAILELGKPIELRMDWNHPEPRHINPHDFQSEQSSDGGKQTDALSSATKKRKRNRNSANKIEEVSPDVPFIKPKPSVRINLDAALKAHNSAIVDEDDELYLRILHGHPPVNIGFVKFGSRMSSTFNDARHAIHRDLDCFEDTNAVISDKTSSKTSIRTKLLSSWRFHVPELGPISFKQEITLGPMLLFLQSASSDLQLGDGTIRRPVKVLIIQEDDICKLVD